VAIKKQIIYMKKTIVIADDNELLRWVLAYRLETDGYDVVTFANGYDAASYMKENKFGLLITDLLMPVMDGMELIRIVRETISKTIPILVISDACDEKCKLKIMELGVSACIDKPVLVGELKAQVQHLICD
jgi:DNA-binding response OmpR family regulator